MKHKNKYVEKEISRTLRYVFEFPIQNSLNLLRI